jgi:hypothetical protein
VASGLMIDSVRSMAMASVAPLIEDAAL